MRGKNENRSKIGALGSKAADLLPSPGQSLFQTTEEPTHPRPDNTGPGQSEDESKGESMFRKNCTLPRSLYKRLKYYAFEHGVTENSVMVDAIRNHLANREGQRLPPSQE